MMSILGQPKSSLILVEDDEAFRKTLVRILNMKGYSVKGVGSACEFYREIMLAKYDLAILDIGLPDQSGLVIAEYLRKNTCMRIVMLSGHTMIEDRIEGYKSGADVYLHKPVNFRELTASIEYLLKRGVVEEVVVEEVVPLGSRSVRESWRLVSTEWALYYPLGERVKLTSKEYEFLSYIALQERQIATRKQLLKVLEYPYNQNGGRALESLVHRLRKKTAGAEQSPIRTAHGTGYCFLPALSIE